MLLHYFALILHGGLLSVYIISFPFCHFRFSRLIDILVHTDANRAGYTEKIWQYPEPGLYSQKLASIISVRFCFVFVLTVTLH